MECIRDHWRFISKDCCLSEEEFIKAVQFVLDSTFFVFDSVIYKQNYGTPMGSPLSPVIADLVMRNLEFRALSSIRFPLPFYYRFLIENYNDINSSGSKPTEMYDLKANMMSFKADLQHYHSLHEFNMQSKYTDFAMQISAELEALKQQLQEKDEQLKKISAEKEQMLQLINNRAQSTITTATL
ncbi:uncharacterized protein [Mycetomoellerius zeteki]|uniref:uncharacterized protein n=1 Tax=Mycetomoellerius zeteki TaxID=64791 RepID=UPI00084EB1FC|nr:PREDICTED: uncharacterized protein LOC108727879 [Trachymyrmex zeteki]